MGSSESKLAVAPSEVADDAKNSVEGKKVCPVTELDPRSPSVGISRTPVREVMRETDTTNCNSCTFARRLGMLFLNDTENKTHQSNSKAVAEGEDDSKPEEISSSEPLLTPQPSDILDSLSTHASMLDTPQLPPPPQDPASPFVHLQDPAFEVELETEPDISLEEAEEARETPIHKRLSLSLIACHEGSTSSQFFEDTTDSFSNVECVEADAKPLMIKEDHSYAIPSITIKSPVEPSISDDDTKDETSKVACESEVAAQSTPEKPKEVEIVKEAISQQSKSESKARTNASSPHPLHNRCLTIDSKSPSQIVFKPQWLGKGFGGVAGQRVRTQAGKGGSSPLALQVAVKNVANENKGQTAKAKTKGSEGRSPLQALRDTNSPLGQRAQMKLKTSTPERRRSAHSDRRVLSIAVDKETDDENLLNRAFICTVLSVL
ncbi:hypothetical protein WMY93_026666 [Mugilogobius chulae]|uniref:Uncharacterized protein n=1 Tax=Mugilogobius chulae TaxID=88201 RepID=A0AAW0NA33_9GOBI